MMRKRILLFLGVFVVLAGSIVAVMGYDVLFESNFKGDPIEFFVHPNTELQDIVEALDSGLVDADGFEKWAELKGLPSKLKPGRYVFTEGMTNREMVNRLSAGIQTPTRLQFHHVIDFADLAGELAQDLQADSVAFYLALNDDEVWSEFKVKAEYRLAYIVPNTYEVYWTTSPKEVVHRLITERDKFWNSSRVEKAKNLGLTPEEVATLASIVQSETYMTDEMSKVAGLYLNRLDKSIKLQADPTVKYAYEKANPDQPKVRRVLYGMLELDSPYNTYKYSGLPPGPLAIPEITAIEAVLNPDKHDYIFMCADPDRPGYHAFAKTVRQHARNAQRYQHSQWGN